MKILFFAPAGMSSQTDELTEIIRLFEELGFSYFVNIELKYILELLGVNRPSEHIYSSIGECADGVSALICYGGDGTFLEGIRRLQGEEIPVLGINSGRLGFLTNVAKENVRQALTDLINGNYEIEKRSTLHIEGDFDSQPEFPFAVNEITLQRNGAGMIYVDTYVNDEMIARYWGDGVLLSTPTGSTAYSLSVGGPVVSPGCECFVLSPIAPHNLTMRPVILPDNCEVTFKVGTRNDNVHVTLDNSNFTANDSSVFCVRKAKKSVFLIKLRNISFYDTLRNKMMWGFDRRDEKPG